MTGPQFFAMAWRISAYEGVMTMRLRAQQERGESRTPVKRHHTAPTATPTAAPVPPGKETHEVHEVSLDQFCFLFPGMVSRSTVSAGEVSGG